MVVLNRSFDSEDEREEEEELDLIFFLEKFILFRLKLVFKYE